jgi:hypothetical protein
MKRVYYPYNLWEEYESGMWRICSSSEKDNFAEQAAALMKETLSFKESMQSALVKWPISCKMNLSAKCMNRRAWLGHAGCCIAIGSPEEATRQGWHYLTDEEQIEANRVTDEVISEWEASYGDIHRANRSEE